MSLKAKAAALKARAESGDAKAKAEYEDLLAVLGATAEYDDEPEGEDGDDAEGADGEDDDAEGEDGGDEAEGADGEDDDAEGEDGEEDDAEAKAAQVLNHAAAKDRPKLAGRLAVKVAAGTETVAGAIALLQSAGKEASGFRKTAGAMTPSGVKSGEPGGQGDQARAALGASMKRYASR